MSKKGERGPDSKVDDLLQDYLLEASGESEETVPSSGARDSSSNARDLADELEGLLQAAAQSATGPRREAIGAKPPPALDASTPVASDGEILQGGMEEFAQFQPTYAGKGSESEGAEAWDDAVEELASNVETKDLLNSPSDEECQDPAFDEADVVGTERSGAEAPGAHDGGEGDVGDEGEDLVGEEPGRQTLPGWLPRDPDDEAGEDDEG
ncbi:MAG: hypothetical protein KAI47_01450 [Deltaproteobacteria bacterium]|nr:hypothetical protein [Deltaproteobacteria bacterium]